jgi:hypothetical protein
MEHVELVVTVTVGVFACAVAGLLGWTMDRFYAPTDDDSGDGYFEDEEEE